MTVELWLAFAAASILLVVFPGPLGYLVSSYALGRGRKAALATVPGATLGLVTAMTAAAVAIALCADLSETLLSMLQWMGIAYLMLFTLWLWKAPAILQPLADNDNLREKRWARIFAHSFAVAGFSPRTIAFFLALLPQFIEPLQKGAAQLAEMQAVLLVIGVVATLTIAVLAAPFLDLVRRKNARMPIRKLPKNHLIARRAVSARYRRMAA